MSNTPPGAEDLVDLLQSKGRRVLVAHDMIDLRKLDGDNDIFVLQLPDGSTAAGGRGGGFGERRIVKAYHYRCGKGECLKVGEYEDEERLESLDLPYHATAFPVILPNGNEKLVSGVADKDLASAYKTILTQ